MRDVHRGASQEIVQTHNVEALIEQGVTKVAAQEPGTTGDDCPALSAITPVCGLVMRDEPSVLLEADGRLGTWSVGYP